MRVRQVNEKTSLGEDVKRKNFLQRNDVQLSAKKRQAQKNWAGYQTKKNYNVKKQDEMLIKHVRSCVSKQKAHFIMVRETALSRCVKYDVN